MLGITGDVALTYVLQRVGQSPIDLPGLDLLEDDEVKALLVSSVEMLEERIAMAEEARERLVGVGARRRAFSAASHLRKSWVVL